MGDGKTIVFIRHFTRHIAGTHIDITMDTHQFFKTVNNAQIILLIIAAYNDAICQRKCFHVRIPRLCVNADFDAAAILNEN